MHLPDFDDIDAKPEGSRTALEQFIYNNDPAPETASSRFRKGLKDTLQEQEAAHRRKVAGMLGFGHTDLPWSWLRSHIKDLLALEEELRQLKESKPNPEG